MVVQILNRVLTFVEKNKKDNIGAFAAQSAFFIIMSTIPFLMVITSFLQYTPISQDYVLSLLQEALPAYIQPFIRFVLTEVYSHSIGVISMSVIVALWSAGKALQYLTAGLNVINDIEESRNWFVVRFWSVVYTLILMLAITLLLMFTVFNNHLRALMEGLVNSKGILITAVFIRPVFRCLFSLGILSGLFLCFFTVLPNKKIKIKTQLPGALLCAAIWYVFSLFLSLYVKIYDRFSIYGSLSTLVLMMFWLYFCMYIMLMCAEGNVLWGEELCAFFEKKWREFVNKWKKS